MRFFFAQNTTDSLAMPSLRLVGFVLVASLFCVPAFASGNTAASVIDSEQAATDPDELDSVPEQAQSVGSLLDALALSEDGQAADVLARQVQNLWNQSGSEAVDLLMRRASVAMQARSYPLALDLLDTVIALEPDYAEGWNRRATVHYLREDYALSIADVEQVLRLEPRHFGALSGIGFILEELGQDSQAQLFLSEALRVHPHMNRTREVLGTIERRLRGAPI
ncbi:MAG: tetratricopeptide repeat protein [Hyphomicrobiales bacterium]